MAIDRSISSGSTPMLLLKLLSEKDMYGYEIIETLKKRSQNVFEMKAGTLYPLLHQLEEKKLLTVYDQEFSGKTRKYYSITKEGRKALAEKSAEWNRYVKAVLEVMNSSEQTMPLFHRAINTDERGDSMNKEEYLNKLVSQIRYKKAHEPIREEIEAHIEDQTEAYEMDGMSYENALEEAVAEMGDPVLVGGELDHIHRPSTPYRLLFLCGTVGFVCLLLRIFMKYNLTELPFAAEFNVQSEVLHWVLGILVMVLICRLDYTFFARKGEMISGIIILAFLIGRKNMINGAYLWIELLPGIRFSSIHVLLLYIPLYAAELYKCRENSIKTLLIRSSFWIIIPMYWAYTIPSIYEMVILLLSFLLILSLAVWKGWYAVLKRRSLATIWGAPILVVGSLMGYILFFTNGYKSERLRAFLFHDAGINNYIYQTVDNVLSHAKLCGKAPEAVLKSLGNNLSVWNYFLLYLTAYFGIIAAILVIGILVGLIARLGYLSITQKNQMGMLIGTGCSVVFLIQILFYVMENLGFTLFGHNYCPFLTYGGSGTIISYALCGIMLSIMRYEKVFPEKDIEKIQAKNTVIS